jgi:hypothetical protein
MQSFSVAGACGALECLRLQSKIKLEQMWWIGIQFHCFVRRIATAHASYDTPNSCKNTAQLILRSTQIPMPSCQNRRCTAFHSQQAQRNPISSHRSENPTSIQWLPIKLHAPPMSSVQVSKAIQIRPSRSLNMTSSSRCRFGILVSVFLFLACVAELLSSPSSHKLSAHGFVHPLRMRHLRA